MVGLFFAYLGVGLTVLTGNPVFDTNASILICLLLAVVSFILVRQNDEPADR
jgi:divalent metal cation (Fe/Co/Zn/Cd) transporter